MNHNNLSNHVMFCNSTGNQSINLIPALQFRLKKTVLLSTTTAKKWTQRLVEVLRKHNIQLEIIEINTEEEKAPNLFVSKVLNAARGYPKVLWNISGGQKIPTTALYSCFNKRLQDKHDDYLCYVEGSDPAIWLYDQKLKSSTIRSNVDLSLADVLYLSDTKVCSSVEIYPNLSEQTKERLDTAKKALEFYKTNDLFREAFFALMQAPEHTNLKDEIKKSLNALMPQLEDLKISKKGYEGLEDSINQLIKSVQNAKTIEDARQTVKKLSLISKPQDIYKEYWNGIKRACIDETIKRLQSFKPTLFQKTIKQKDRDDFIAQLESIGGSVNSSNENIYKHDVEFSSIGKNSELFEWMVASAVLEAIENNSEIKNSISQVHCHVKTQLIDADCSKNDAEIDVLITTKFGTLIVLEAKTYDFTGDVAKSKESIAYKKSGPFAKAIIVGPMLKSIIKEKPDGTKQFPHYFDGKIKDQEQTAKQHKIKYWYLDEIEQELKKELYIR